MITVNLFDVLPDTGIFTAINNIKAFPWSDIITPAQMDISYKQMYSGKPVSKMVLRYLGENTELTEDNIKALANILYNMYYEKWVLAYNLFASREKTFALGYEMTVTETTTHDNKTTDTGTTKDDNTETGQISAFNSTDFADKDKTVRGGVNTRDLAGTDTGTKTRTYNRTGHDANIGENYIKTIKALQDYLLYDIIFIDANSVLTLHIYN